MTTAERIKSLFAGLDRAHGGFEITHEEGGKLKGRAYTRQEAVTLELWEKHLAGKHGLGIVPINDSGNSKWGCIDIDQNTINHNELCKKIDKLRLPLVTCRSKSGGAHLFMFLKTWVPAKTLQSKLNYCASSLGFSKVEIFPKQTQLSSEADVGNWLNMPYFNDTQTIRFGYKDGNQVFNVDDFLDYAESKQITLDELEAIRVEVLDEFVDAPPCLQYLTMHGFPGNLNNALFSMGVFARKKFSDSWESKVDQYNIEYMKPGSSKEVQNIVRELGKKSYFYKCNDEPLRGYCNKPLCKKQKYGIATSKESTYADDPEVIIDGIQKLTTTPPVWFVNVKAPDGHNYRLQITDTAKLLSQAHFSIMCVEAFNFLPSLIKPKKWYVQVQEAVAKAENIEAPREASSEGILIAYLQEWLVGKVQAKNREELKLGKPWHDDSNKLYYFKSEPFFNYIKQRGIQWFAGWKPPRFYATLKEHGVSQENLHGVGRVWRIEASKFDKPLTDLDIPEVVVTVDDDTPF